MDTIVEEQAGQIEVVGGVDTHRDTHTAAVLDTAGRLLGHQQFPVDKHGYDALLAWLDSYGSVLVIGIEGSGSYGAGLCEHAREHGVDVVEVDRPDRRTRRFAGKSDPIDAEAAGRNALARARTGVPKSRQGPVEALRNLRVARRSAVEQRADLTRQIKSLIVTAPEDLRARLRSCTDTQLLRVCAALRPDLSQIHLPEQAAKTALRSLARRHSAVSQEIADLDALIEPLVTSINPRLMQLNGVGPDNAGQLLTTAGQNADRLRSEGSFAMLCGVAPIPASSGRTNRHRLNRGGDRQANAALYRIVLSRLRWDERTRAYMARRTAQGLSKKEVIRCLKRLVAREIYYVLTTTPQPATTHLDNAA